MIKSNPTKKNNFPVKFFVIAALADFILVMLAIALYKAAVFSVKEQSISPASSPAFFTGATKSPDPGDPLITKVPDLGDVISRPINNPADPGSGPDKASVTIAQFSDFECAACRANMETALKLAKEYPGKIKFIWKDFPPADISSNLWQAALAARCAGDQGEFFDYGRLIFENSAELDKNLFPKLAVQLNLDADKLNNCFFGYEKNKEIIDNLTEAEALKITGVPTVYVNDKIFTGELSEKALKETVEKELNNDK